MKKLLACVVCFSLSAWIVAAGDAGKGPKVEGTWTIISASFGGKKLPGGVLEKLMARLTFKEGKYSSTVMGKEDEAGTYTIDAKKKPIQVDFKITEGKDKGKTQFGLLKVEGDDMTMAMAKPGSKDRPKDFDGGEGVAVTVLRRGK